MSDHLTNDNILRHRYGAEVCEGRRRFVSKTWHHNDLVDYPDRVTDTIDMSIVHSVQVDMHPADFNRLCDTLEYIHGGWPPGDKNMTATQQLDWKLGPKNAGDSFIESMYHKRQEEQQLRERHPLLQDLWQQYQVTLNLIKAGNNVEGSD